MSILQEFEQIRQCIGEEKYQQIVKFLKAHPHYDLADVYYSEQVCNECFAWNEKQKKTKRRSRKV